MPQFRVFLMDDDLAALNFQRGLLMRDLRSTCAGYATSPEKLLDLIDDTPKKLLPKLIVLDAEYETEFEELKLPKLIKTVKEKVPGAKVACLSQYCVHDTMRDALNAGVDAVLEKNSVYLGYVAALVRTLRSELVVCGDIPAMLCRLHGRKAVVLPKWQPHPDLRPVYLQVFHLCILDGMSAREAGREINRSPTTVETYLKHCYNILEDGWIDSSDLEAVKETQNWEKLARRDWAFHKFTAFPPPK